MTSFSPIWVTKLLIINSQGSPFLQNVHLNCLFFACPLCTGVAAAVSPLKGLLNNHRYLASVYFKLSGPVFQKVFRQMSICFGMICTRTQGLHQKSEKKKRKRREKSPKSIYFFPFADASFSSGWLNSCSKRISYCFIVASTLMPHYTRHKMGQVTILYRVLFFTCAQLLFVPEVLLLRGRDYHCYTHLVCAAH